MMLLPGLSGPIMGSASRPQLSASFVTATTSATSSGATRIFSNVSIGAAPTSAHDRYIVAIHGYSNLAGAMTFNSGTIAGNAATVAGYSVEDYAGINRNGAAMMIYGPLNTGTTATINATWSDWPDIDDGLITYQILTPRGMPMSLTPYDTCSAEGTFGATPTAYIDIPSGGVCIGGVQSQNSSNPAWSGLVEDGQVDVAGTDYLVGASDAFIAPKTQWGITVTGVSNHAWIAASWGV